MPRFRVDCRIYKTYIIEAENSKEAMKKAEDRWDDDMFGETPDMDCDETDENPEDWE